MNWHKDFPILDSRVSGHPLIYLDNAATMQMPKPVWQRVEEHYRTEHGNVNRGGHFTGRKSSEQYDQARTHVQHFIGANSSDEILFTSGTTSSINLAARMMEMLIEPEDEIIVTEMEHHSNLLPWVELCRRRGAKLKLVPLTDQGELNQAAFRQMLSMNTKLVALGWVSNVLGTVNPVEEMIQIAHAYGAMTLIDGAQAVAHIPVDVSELGCDLFAFSGHKLGALTGIGVLYVRRSLLEQFEPQDVGGGTVREVRGTKAIYAQPPQCFEAGTPNYVGAISLDATLSYWESQGLRLLHRSSEKLLAQTERVLSSIDGIRILGAPNRRAGAVSFVVEGVQAYDLAKLLDLQGIAVRSGHLCAQNTLLHFGVSEAVRVSPAFYNTVEELTALHQALISSLRLLHST